MDGCSHVAPDLNLISSLVKSVSNFSKFVKDYLIINSIDEILLKVDF